MTRQPTATAAGRVARTCTTLNPRLWRAILSALRVPQSYVRFILSIANGLHRELGHVRRSAAGSLLCGKTSISADPWTLTSAGSELHGGPPSADELASPRGFEP